MLGKKASLRVILDEIKSHQVGLFSYNVTQVSDH